MLRQNRWIAAIGTGVIATVFSLPVLAQEGQFQGEVVGKVKQLSADHHRLTVRDADNRDWTFTVNDATKVEQKGQPAKLGDLKVGDRVDVVYNMNGYAPKTIQTLPKDRLER